MPMSPRRSKKNADLAGTNLHTTGKYLYYKHPVTGKKTYLTQYTRAQAIQFALEANRRIAARQTGGADDSIGKLLDRFVAEYLPLKQYAPTTERGVLMRLNIIRRQCAGLRLRDISVLTLKQYLDPLTPHARKHQRHVWIELYKFALSEGLAEHNLAERTLLQKLPTRQRQRLTLQQFQQIHDAAPAWFQTAMLAALLTLQRRADLVNIKLADYQNGVLSLVQSKTGIGIRITGNSELDHLFQRAAATPIASPYLIHRKPKHLRREYINKKHHWSQVSPEMLTRTFKRLRDQVLGPAENPPTWYEIKSLGGRLLLQQGHNAEFVQLLMGHSNPKTTQIYLDNGINWTQAEIGLTLDEKK